MCIVREVVLEVLVLDVLGAKLGRVLVLDASVLGELYLTATLVYSGGR